MTGERSNEGLAWDIYAAAHGVPWDAVEPDDEGLAEVGALLSPLLDQLADAEAVRVKRDALAAEVARLRQSRERLSEAEIAAVIAAAIFEQGGLWKLPDGGWDDYCTDVWKQARAAAIALSRSRDALVVENELLDANLTAANKRERRLERMWATERDRAAALQTAARIEGEYALWAFKQTGLHALERIGNNLLAAAAVGAVSETRDETENQR